ncbi:39S ribosomal protein L28, mitochondrial [Orussus abietinus]|uniref:39S ribosomal protein L28, mitochondrial n=1 Tax=Orussus abietinus TaxID=222816 RepID=UPI00062541FF|nr:39S ribosomal protein L28, mitochondrial [Orussus abietinus]
MAAAKGQSLYYFKKPTRWTSGIGLELPEAYKKFWKEWKMQKPTAVHYIEEQGNWKIDERSGQVVPVQNVPLLVQYPKEQDEGIWGGEGVVQGFQKRKPKRRRVPHFWVPSLRRTVIYSEVLNMYTRTNATERALQLIHENYGLDHYLLKTPACDLKSLLALKIKRQILIALADKNLYQEEPEKQEEIYTKYRQYLSAYTREEIEWYGLSYPEACKKWVTQKTELNKPQPLKLQFRSDLIQKLKENKLEGITKGDSAESSKSWISKLNPFSKSSKTQ